MINSNLVTLEGLPVGAIVGISFACLFLLIIILAIAFLLWYIRARNWFRQQRVKINQASSTIDVALTKRYDLLNKKVQTVNAGSKVEIEGIRDIIALRQQHPHFDNVDDMNKFNQAMDKVQNQVNVVAEQYPQIKTTPLYITLLNDETDIEEQMMAVRRMFNSVVGDFNTRCVTFPYSWIAKTLGYTQIDFFEAEDYKRPSPDVKFWTPSNDVKDINTLRQGSKDDPANEGKD